MVIKFDIWGLLWGSEGKNVVKTGKYVVQFTLRP
jgi:hypothetical protein